MSLGSEEKMNLFYVDRTQITDEIITILGDDVNHIKNVLRMREGEEIAVCDGEGMDYLCAIKEMNQKNVQVQIVSSKKTETELPAKIYLFQGLPKKDKMDLIIQKTVELGVHEIIPVSMKRSVVKIEEGKKEAKKLERWNSIAESAAKQSKRGMIPAVHSVMRLKEAVEYAKQLDLTVVPYENEKGMTHTKAIVEKAIKQKTIGIFIGPEGGFDDSEIELLQSCNMETVTLGKRILRTETAGLCMMSILMFEMEQE